MTRFADKASWIELDAAAFTANLQTFRRMMTGQNPSPRLGVVLKGNAYGHGLREVLPVVHPYVDCIYFISAEDALWMRRFEADAGLAQKDVLVIGALSAGEVESLARHQVAAVVGDEGYRDWALHLHKARTPPLRVHLHVDTGLGREGFLVDELTGVLDEIRAQAPVLQLAGVLSHFANVEDVTEQSYALQQLHAFQDALRVCERTVPGCERHFAASAASLVLPEARFDTLRVGISLYGLWPSTETRLSTRVVTGETPALSPVLSWRCKSQTVRSLPAGSDIGYGCTYRCSRPTRIAVLPVGYFDGYPRLLSGKAHVLVQGKRCPLLGRVMMNHIIVDVSGVELADCNQVEATLIGRDGDEQISAETLAGWADTISYEIVSRLGAHLRRVVV